MIDLSFWGSLILALLLRNALASLVFPATFLAVLALTNRRATLRPLTPIQLRKNRTRASIQTVAAIAVIALLAYLTTR